VDLSSVEILLLKLDFISVLNLSLVLLQNSTINNQKNTKQKHVLFYQVVGFRSSGHPNSAIYSRRVTSECDLTFFVMDKPII
jgi:hypothetical protein